MLTTEWIFICLKEIVGEGILDFKMNISYRCSSKEKKYFCFLNIWYVFICFFKRFGGTEVRKEFDIQSSLMTAIQLLITFFGKFNLTNSVSLIIHFFCFEISLS